jgi:hemoglobin/transferrin/lactoferrin receptor protein
VRTLGYVLEWHAQPSKIWSMSSGAEYYGDWVRSSGQDINTETGLGKARRGLYPDSSRAGNWGLFHTQQLRLNTWTFHAGLRYNGFSIRLQDALFGDVDIRPNAVVGHFLLQRQLGKGQYLSGGLSQGFRAPNINDMSSFGRFDFGVEVPSYDLEPEHSLTYQLTYKLETKAVRFNAHLYHTALRAGITRVRGTFNGSPTYLGDNVYQKANTAKSFVRGMEADFSWQMGKKWLFSGNTNYTFGQNTSANEPMRRIPPFFAAATLAFQTTSHWRNSLDFLCTSKQSRLAAGDKSDPRIPTGGTPGWQVLNLRSTYAWKALSLHAGLNNLFNQAYRTHGSGIDGQGRSIWGTLEWRF